MEIKYIQLYDCLGRGANTKFGSIIEENEYHNGMWIPNVGQIIRMDSGKYNGLYEVVAVVYSKPTKLIRIKMEKMPDIFEMF